MAKVASHPTRIWLDHYPLASYLTASDVTIDQETIPVTTFADAGPRRLVGNYDHKGSHSGLFDAGSTSDLDPVLASLFNDSAAHQFLQSFGSAAEGAVCLERAIRFKDRAFKSAIGAATLLNFNDEGDGAAVRANILRTGAITGTEDGTGQNLGATSSGQQLQVVYRILAVSGSGSIVMQIHESSDDGGSDSYASIAALASGTLTGVGATKVSTTGATEAYKRVSVTTFSGFTSVTVLVTIGLVPNVA